MNIDELASIVESICTNDVGPLLAGAELNPGALVGSARHLLAADERDVAIRIVDDEGDGFADGCLGVVLLSAVLSSTRRNVAITASPARTRFISIAIESLSLPVAATMQSDRNDQGSDVDSGIGVTLGTTGFGHLCVTGPAVGDRFDCYAPFADWAAVGLAVTLCMVAPDKVPPPLTDALINLVAKVPAEYTASVATGHLAEFPAVDFATRSELYLSGIRAMSGLLAGYRPVS